MKVIDLTKIDLTEEPKSLKKIELISCLKSFVDENGNPFFGSDKAYGGCFRNFEKIKLAARNVHGGMDLILLERGGLCCVFLGYWNDGVI